MFCLTAKGFLHKSPYFYPSGYPFPTPLALFLPHKPSALSLPWGTPAPLALPAVVAAPASQSVSGISAPYVRRTSFYVATHHGGCACPLRQIFRFSKLRGRPHKFATCTGRSVHFVSSLDRCNLQYSFDHLIEHLPSQIVHRHC